MKEFFIPQYNETWIFQGEEAYDDGSTYYRFKVKGKDDEITHFNREDFDDLFIRDIIK